MGEWVGLARRWKILHLFVRLLTVPERVGWKEKGGGTMLRDPFLDDSRAQKEI